MVGPSQATGQPRTTSLPKVVGLSEKRLSPQKMILLPGVKMWLARPEAWVNQGQPLPEEWLARPEDNL